MLSIRDQFPLRLIINGEDVSFELGEGFSFSCTDPGGFEAASFPIPRDMPFLNRGDPVRLECGLSTAWEGRVKEIQRSLGAKTLVQCEGDAAILKENLLAEIFVDRDLTKWVGPTVDEQLYRMSINQIPNGSTVAINPNGEPAVVNEFTGPWTINPAPMSIAVYSGQGIPIQNFYFEFEASRTIGLPDSHWELWVSLENGGGFGGGATGNIMAASGSGYTTSYGIPTGIGVDLWMFYTAEGGGQSVIYAVYWSKLAVYGAGYHTHWNQYKGPDPVGIWPSDIAGYTASLIPTIQRGIFENASHYIVPHAAYLTPVPAEQIISDMAKFAAWHWGVWESLAYLTGSQLPRLDFREGPSEGEPTVWCWRSECEECDVRENLENLYDSAKVSYIEPAGIERSVEVTKDNPTLDAVGLHRQASLSLGTGTKEAAEAWGLIQLDLLNDQARATGTIRITEPVHRMSGTQFPAWMLRAGLDRLRVVDLPCTDVWGEHNDLPITRVECSGSEQGLTTNIELGTTPLLLETLAARIQANETAAGV